MNEMKVLIFIVHFIDKLITVKMSRINFLSTFTYYLVACSFHWQIDHGENVTYNFCLPLPTI